jgi:hypothetical protein
MNFNQCAGCGNEVMQSMRICPNCGGRAFGKSPPAPAPSLQNNYAQQNGANSGGLTTAVTGIPPGVKGWLLFLCVNLTVITPLWGLGFLGKEWAESKQYLDIVPNFKEALMIEFFVMAIFLLYSIYTGVQLWKIRPNAVKNAKQFFVINLLLCLTLQPVMAQMLGVQFMNGDYLKSVFGGILNIAIWYPYLLKSKRVMATY